MTTKDFWESLRAFSVNGRDLFGDLFNNIEKFVEYNEAREEALNEPDEQQDDVLVLRLIDETHGIGVKYDLLAEDAGNNKGGENNNIVVSSAQTSNNEECENMKYLTKRHDGRWSARKTINGKRISVYGRTQAEAYEKLKQIGSVKRSSKQQSFYEFAQFWLVTYKKDRVSPKTYRGYKNIIDNHLKITTLLNRLSVIDLQKIINGISASRIREAVCQVMKAVLRKAYELDYIKKDISPFLEKGKIEKGSRQALSLDDQRKLLSALRDDTFSRRVLFYLCTGARPAEFATVKKAELHPGWVRINGTKTAKAVRWVKVSARISNMLMNETDDFFTFDIKRFREHLQRVCIDAGISTNVDIYTLRHTFATNLYILRVPEKDRQQYMGHVSGSAMTNDVYTTFTPDTSAKDIYDIYGDLYPEF